MGVIVTEGGVAEAVARWLLNRIRDLGGDVEICVVLSGVALLGAIAVMAFAKRALKSWSARSGYEH